MNKEIIYLDHAATTPIDPQVLDLMINHMKSCYGNPSSTHSFGRKSRILVESARKTIAKALNCSLGEIYFTSSATESNNTVLRCSVRDLGVERIISTRAEHKCVANTLKCLEKSIEIDYLNLDQDGQISYGELKDKLENSSKKTLVCLMYVNNEIGTVFDIDRISSMCQENDCLFFTDAVQAVGKLKIDLESTKVSFLTASAHKINGPKGVGFIYINGGNNIKPFITGGGQERNMRAGTENLHGIIGLGKALEMWENEREIRLEIIKELKSEFLSIVAQNNPDVIHIGTNAPQAPHILNLGIPLNRKNDMVMINLDILGICASSGSACSSGAEKSSHVFSAIGLGDKLKGVRFSFSYSNTLDEVKKAAEGFLKSISTEVDQIQKIPLLS